MAPNGPLNIDGHDLPKNRNSFESTGSPYTKNSQQPRAPGLPKTYPFLRPAPPRVAVDVHLPGAHSGGLFTMPPFHMSQQSTYKSPYGSLSHTQPPSQNGHAHSPVPFACPPSLPTSVQNSAASSSTAVAVSAHTYADMEASNGSGEYDFLNEYASDHDDEMSDADSDTQMFHSNLSKFKNSVRQFRAEQAADSEEDTFTRTRGSRRRRGRGSRGRYRPRGSRKAGVREPRRAAEPTGEIKYRLSVASQAFIEERYDEAHELVNDVIRLNAETFEAWMLMASIWKEKGDVDNSLHAMEIAAHMRPNHQDVWMRCARFALEETGDQRTIEHLKRARFHYGCAIRANPKLDTEARLGKAHVLRLLSNHKTAITEYTRVLKNHPHDTSILWQMAETFIDLDNVEAAIKLYTRSIQHFKSNAANASQRFGWSDVNIYVELYGYLGQYVEAIRELKELSRWLLGRQEEAFWDRVDEDDREWDADDSRRTLIPEFGSNNFHADQYGNGLPLELRVKLGLFRLRLGDYVEAKSHLMWLDPENVMDQDMIVDYPDLFRDAADGLFHAELFKEAIAFYIPLQDRLDQSDSEVSLHLGKCYLGIGDDRSAEDCFRTAIQIDNSSIEARMQLAKLYERQNEQEMAFLCVNEVMAIQRSRAADDILPHHRLRKRGQPKVRPAEGPNISKPTQRLTNAELRRQEEMKQSESLQQQYAIMRTEQSGMEAGSESSTLAWMTAAKALIDDFRGFRKFYPWDKYLKFMGYSGSDMRSLTGAAPLDPDIADMAERLSTKLGANVDKTATTMVGIPDNYRGIAFQDWLDIFLQYALCLARFDRTSEAFEVCEAAEDACVFYHDKDHMFLINVCHCVCAVLGGDEETCLQVCRYFMARFQFSTDSYRMFAALSKLNRSPSSWYSSGPTQKYMLRQIKAMDFVFVEEEQQSSMMAEKASYSAQDEHGNKIINKDLDISLLMLYGHILAAGGSHAFALNYYFRSLALDPQNPMINLSIGLAYVQHGMKRQADNRQYHIMQGMSFLFNYYDTRVVSKYAEERQEAHYCIARTYHLLGLTHLALPYYSKILKEVQEVGPSSDGIQREAAYNLQTLCMAAGNHALAKAVTEKWLVI